MKKTAGTIIFILVLALLANTFIGCISYSVARYSFAENENEAASITFLKNKNKSMKIIREDVNFIDLDGVNLPEPEWNTIWGDTVMFPAGVPLKIRVEMNWDFNNVKGKKDVGHKMIVFECPPLEAGKEYQLRFIHEILGSFGFMNKTIGETIYGDSLVLKDISTGETIHAESFKIIISEGRSMIPALTFP